MKVEVNAKLVTIFVNSTDQWHGRPLYSAIVRYAEGEGMNLVVVGQHGHSRIARFFLGSTSDRVSEHSPCTVMIVK